MMARKTEGRELRMLALAAAAAAQCGFCIVLALGVARLA